jgi:hypothetical protein
MSHPFRFTLVLSAALTVSSPSLSQSAASSAASSSVSQSAPTAKPAGPPQPPQQKQAKYFIEVYRLTSGEFAFPADSCFAGRLHFPVTNAANVARLLGSESGFTLTAIPPDRVAVYYKLSSVPTTDRQKLEQHMTELASSDISRAVAIRVPAGSASKIVSQLTLPADGSIALKAVGNNCVLLISKQQSDPVTLAGLMATVSEAFRDQPSAPPTQRLFYVDATALSKKLSGSNEPSADTSKTPASKTNAPKPSTTTADDSANTSGFAAPSVSVSVASGGTSPNANKTTPDSGPDSSDSTDQSKPANTDTTGSASKMTDAAPGASDKTKGKTASTPPKPPAIQAFNDTLIYSNDDGSDRGIFERNRLMAVLDLPRPEVLMNIWSLQASSKNYKIVTSETEAARDLVANHNDLLQRAIDKGWGSLSRQMGDPTFFDTLFYRYVTQKFGETEYQIEPRSSQSVAELFPAEGRKTNNEENLRHAGTLEQTIDSNRTRWGWCDTTQYCLGFSHALEPLRPTFTNLLIGVVAAKKPLSTAEQMIRDMETATSSQTNCTPQPPGQEPCQDRGAVTRFRACMSKVDKQLHTFSQQSNSCEVRDRINLSEQIIAGQDESLRLTCFKEQAQESFGPEEPQQRFQSALGKADYATTRVGLLRAAIADFLFNYKWATQYPHDFIPYDLTQSAQELNAQFNPLVLAFNRDVSAFTENLQAELQCKYEANISGQESKGWFSGGDKTFINDGILSVRGISGVESLVDTVTQSFFEATNPPSLTDLAKSVSDAEKNTPGVLKANLTADEASVLLGALNSVQPATAKIGRELKLDITPHSLAGASSAELEVKLTAQETANPTRFTADKSADDTLSRVAKHDVSTRVRVESLKLFEISAFSAMLQRPRSKFPIVLPFVEVPYFGSFVGWPLSGAKVYHRSTAVISAIIVPTATDLAFGIDFGADRVCGEEGCRRAKSPDDFGNMPLRNFHKAMIECFASGGSTPYPGLRQNVGLILGQAGCENLSLFEVSRTGQNKRPSAVPPTE